MSKGQIEDNSNENKGIQDIGNMNLDYYYTNGDKGIKTSIEKNIKSLEGTINSLQSSTQEDNGKIKQSIDDFFLQHNAMISRHLHTNYTNSNSNNNKIPSLDNYLKLKTILNDKLQSKSESLVLLSKAKSLLSSSSNSNSQSITVEKITLLIKELKGNKMLSSNKQLLSSLTTDLNKLSKHITQAQINQKENQTEQEALSLTSHSASSLVFFHSLIKSSYEEALSNIILDTSPFEILKDLNYISTLDSPNAKANELKEKYIISPSFKIFILKLFNDSSSLSFSDLKKTIALLHLFYDSHIKQLESSSANEIPIVLQLHNNIEMFLIVLSYKILFSPSSPSNDTAAAYSNIFIFLKNFSSDLIMQIIANIITQLTTEIYQIESFERISYESNYRNCESMFDNTQALIFKFFSSLKQYAIQREFVFNLNYVLSLLFDVINRKILLVKDFSVNDIKSLLSLGKKVAPKLKANLELIAGDDSSLSAKLIGVLDQNGKYKKFEEIMFVLNANLKEIRNFLIEAEFNIHIDANELIELITSIFEMNENSKGLIEFIKDKLLSEKAE